jgi:pilus assembly protein CpaF
VTEIVAVEDLAGGADAAQFTVTQLFHRPQPDDQLVWTGNVPVRLGRALHEQGVALGDLLGRGDRPAPAAVPR